MKKLSYLIVGLLLFGGCTYKNEAIPLKSYKAQYSGDKVQAKKTIKLAFVKDMRADKRTIGYVLEGSEKSVSLYSEVDFAKKYEEGLGFALNIAGFDTKVSEENADRILEVYIENIEIERKYDSFDKNVKGVINIKVLLKEGKKTTTYNFKEESSKWIKPSYSSEDLEPFLYMIYIDSINNIVEKLVSVK